MRQYVVAFVGSFCALVGTAACFPEFTFDEPNGTGGEGGGTGVSTGGDASTGTGGATTGVTGGGGATTSTTTTTTTTSTSTTGGAGGEPPMVQVPCDDMDVGQTLCAVGEACCYDWSFPFEDDCQPALQCPLTHSPLTCTSASDCSGGDVCCGLYNASLDIVDAVVCTAACTGDDILFCDPAGPACPTGSCVAALGDYPGYYWCQ